MGRPKKVTKAKEPVRIRERKRAHGNSVLYLDIYQKGTRKTETLGLYIVPERTPLDRQQNERILGLRKFGVKQYDKVRRSAMTLVDYLVGYENDTYGYSSSTIRGRKDMRRKVEAYLAEIVRPDLAVAEVDEDFLKGFIAYLSSGANDYTGNKLTGGKAAAHHHQAVLNGALNKAVREGLLPNNPMKSIAAKEKFQPNESEREYLSLHELKRAAETDCPNPEVKKAFMFSCLIGLRLSDVRALTWKKILTAPDGKRRFVRMKMQKTQKLLDVPLSEEALSYLNPRDNNERPIFILPNTTNVNLNIAKWMQAAGIEKHVSYHCSRHTFATSLLTLGVDIYTVSKLLGHANVATTAIYAKIVDAKKTEAIGLMDKFLGGEK